MGLLQLQQLPRHCAPGQAVGGGSGNSPRQAGSLPTLTLWRQVEADVPVIMHGAVELAVTGLAEVEGPPAVQLLAVGVVAYLARPEGEAGRTGPPQSAPRPPQCTAGLLLGPRAALHFPTVHSPQGAPGSLIHSAAASQTPLCVHSERRREKHTPALEERTVEGRLPVRNQRQLPPGPLPGAQAGRAPRMLRAAVCVRQLRVGTSNPLLSSLQTLCSKFCDLSGPCMASLAWDGGASGGVRERRWQSGCLGTACPQPPTSIHCVYCAACTRSPPAPWVTATSSLPFGSHSLPLTPLLPTFLVPLGTDRSTCLPRTGGFPVPATSRRALPSPTASGSQSIGSRQGLPPLHLRLHFSHSLSAKENPVEEVSILTTSWFSLPVLVRIFS